MRRSKLTYSLVVASIVGVGISSIANQILIIREFLSQFHGNELTISVVVFCWLTLGGIGSLCCKPFKGSIVGYSAVLFFASVFPIVQILVIRAVKEMFFVHGASVGFYPTLGYVFITTSLYCFTIGFILPYSQKTLKKLGFNFDTGILYVTDNIGDILGGLVTSFVLIYVFKPFSIIGITSSAALLISLYLTWTNKGWKACLPFMLIGTGFFFVCLNKTIEVKSLSLHYGNVVKYLESPYGRIVVTKEQDQFTVWESDTPFYFQRDIIKAEEKVHYALCQLKHVKKVLLVSGGLGMTIKELKKYRPERIDYVELDPCVTKVAIELRLIPKCKNLRIINTDARKFIKDTKSKYSAIVIDLPDPDTFQINRFFTREFFLLVKSRLTKDGIVLISTRYSPNYMGKVRRKKVSILYNTLLSCFRYVEPIPGSELYFIAGNRPIYRDIPKRLKTLHIKTVYAGPYFYGNVTPDRIAYLKKVILSDKRVNTDLTPVLVSVAIQEWFEKFHTKPVYFFAILFAGCLVYLMFIKKEEYLLFSTGLSLMGVEMLVIFLFQICYGYVYLKVGTIISLFLLGLLPGAFFGIKSKGYSKKWLILSEVGILSMLGICLFGIFFLDRIPKWLFFLYPFLFSLLCGLQFPMVAEIIGEEHSPASKLFAADLIGASFGTILVSTLVPFCGIISAVLGLVLFKIASAVIMLKSLEGNL